MTQPGRAAIEIVGDASKLGPQLERDAQRAIDNTELDLTSISRQIGDGFADGIDIGEAEFERSQAFITEYFESIAAMAEETADDIAIHFEDGGARIVKTFRDGRREADGLFDDIGDGAADAGRDVTSGLIRPLQQGFTNLGGVLSSVGSALVGIAATGTNPAGLATLLVSILAFTAAIPVVLGVAAALAQLAGLLTVLPAAIGGAASALIVGTIAFQGFGDALSAIADGDPEKIAEALERLAPAARRVAREFQAILPGLRQVGDMIQQRFFEPLVGQLELFGTRTLPLLRDELGDLSGALGGVVDDLGDMAQSTGNVEILGRLIDSTTIVTDKLGGAFTRLGDALFGALDASLPMLEDLGASLAEGLDNFTGWLTGAVEDGSFQQFWEDALDVLGRVWNLVKAVGDLVGTLFSGTEEGGKDFIDTLTDLTKRLTEFFKSVEGQEALQDFEEIIGAVGSILGYVINITREVIDIFTELDDAVEAVIFFFEDLWDGTVEVWNGITETISGAIDSIVTFFSELPDKIASFVESIPGRIAAFFDLLVDQALNILALGIAAIIVFFTDLPGQLVGALTALWETISTWFGSIRDRAIEIFNNVVTFFQELPGKIEMFLASLPGRISAFFQQAKDGVVAKLTEMINFVKGVPGKILSALGNVGTMLLESGKRIIQGLIDGISSKLGALREKIASAVQTIRDHLPFSPAKTGPLSGSGSPQIAGAVIAEMIAAGLDSGHGLITDAAARAAGATTSPFGAIGQAGGAPLLSPGGPGAPAGVLTGTQAVVEQQPVFIIQIGNEEIQAFIDKRVDSAVQVEVRRLLAGTRGIG